MLPVRIEALAGEQTGDEGAERVHVDVGGEDLRALADHRFGRSAADTLARRGHKCAFAVQPHRILPERVAPERAFRGAG